MFVKHRWSITVDRFLVNSTFNGKSESESDSLFVHTIKEFDCGSPAVHSLKAGSVPGGSECKCGLLILLPILAWNFFLVCLYRAWFPLLYASSLPFCRFLRFHLNHSLLLLHVQKVLVRPHMSVQKLMYDVTVRMIWVNSLRSMAAASKALHSLHSKQACNVNFDSSVHFL